ncbi:MAG: type II toxin-antitoxin system prevent-host-death family antitoxin [Candidatus Limnocylindrales bacterium]
MTLGREVEALGMREVRERIRAVVARTADSGPLVIMQHGEPAAVLLRFEEAERWGRVERGLAALHGLEVYPELVRGTAQMSAAVRGELRPTRAAVRAIDEQPREILGPLATVQITDLRERLASCLDEVSGGRALTVVSSGRFAATLVSPREFDRIRQLGRAVAWFAAAGLDLASAGDAEVAAFVVEYRRGGASRAGSAAG